MPIVDSVDNGCSGTFEIALEVASLGTMFFFDGSLYFVLEFQKNKQNHFRITEGNCCRNREHAIDELKYMPDKQFRRMFRMSRYVTDTIFIYYSPF